VTHPSDTPPRKNIAYAIHGALRCLRLRSEGQGHDWNIATIHQVFADEWDLRDGERDLLSQALELEAGKR